MPSERKLDCKAYGKERSEAKAVAREGNGKVNIAHEEQDDGEQHSDPVAVSAITRDEWIMVLEREAHCSRVANGQRSGKDIVRTL